MIPEHERLESEEALAQVAKKCGLHEDSPGWRDAVVKAYRKYRSLEHELDDDLARISKDLVEDGRPALCATTMVPMVLFSSEPKGGETQEQADQRVRAAMMSYTVMRGSGTMQEGFVFPKSAKAQRKLDSAAVVPDSVVSAMARGVQNLAMQKALIFALEVLDGEGDPRDAISKRLEDIKAGFAYVRGVWEHAVKNAEGRGEAVRTVMFHDDKLVGDHEAWQMMLEGQKEFEANRKKGEPSDG